MEVNTVSKETTSLDKLARIMFSVGHIANDIAYMERLSPDDENRRLYSIYAKPTFSLFVRLIRDLSEQLGYSWDEVIKLGDEKFKELFG